MFQRFEKCISTNQTEQCIAVDFNRALWPRLATRTTCTRRICKCSIYKVARPKQAIEYIVFLNAQTIWSSSDANAFWTVSSNVTFAFKFFGFIVGSGLIACTMWMQSNAVCATLNITLIYVGAENVVLEITFTIRVNTLKNKNIMNGNKHKTSMFRK